MAQILTALAEGLGIRATSRVFGLAWVSAAGPQLALFHQYHSRQLE